MLDGNTTGISTVWFAQLSTLKSTHFVERDVWMHYSISNLTGTMYALHYNIITKQGKSASRSWGNGRTCGSWCYKNVAYLSRPKLSTLGLGYIHRVRKKRVCSISGITSSNTDRYWNSFTVTICRKFAIKLSLNIPPHLKRVATLPCE